MIPDLRFEHNHIDRVIAGVDEAGRGALAGPVVAGAVIVNQKDIISGINDSKKLSAKKREDLYNEITTRYIWGIGIVEQDEIDQINILEATKKACELAIQNLTLKPEIALVDGNMRFYSQLSRCTKFISIIKGDNLSLSIAAGSIIAKVTRDRLMSELDKKYPQYLWRNNFGYGTKQHLKAIAEYGKCLHHRLTFKIKALET